MNQTLDSSAALALLDVILSQRNMSFAYLDNGLRIRLADPGLAAFVEGEQSPLPGSYLPDVFIEFFGLEDTLRAIMRGEAQVFYLSPVARETPTGQARYVSFQVLHLQNHPLAPGLLLVEDITSTGKLEQHLIQERNEMRLLRAELMRANAELQRLNQFKSTMLSMAAHDLRSPLSSLVLQLGLLLQDLQTGQQTMPWTELLQWMQSTAGRMNNLIAGLLDSEQAEQGKLVLQLTQCDLVALIEHVIRMAPPEAIHRFELDAPPTGLELVADSERLQQVFYNLIDNALKYTPAEQPISITIRRQDGWGRVDVRDRGSGMTPEQLANLFQMYYRTDQARQGAVAGRGLGLFIVKTLVEAHGGQVKVQSEVSQGTTFSVYLPVSQSVINEQQSVNQQTD